MLKYTVQSLPSHYLFLDRAETRRGKGLWKSKDVYVHKLWWHHGSHRNMDNSTESSQNLSVRRQQTHQSQKPKKLRSNFYVIKIKIVDDGFSELENCPTPE